MAGNKMGAIKAKLGLRGPTKPGEMISRMNKLNSSKPSAKVITKSIKAII